ncbi:MAG: cysteine desulfurase family protein [Acidobacteriota bacterium]|nr:cysteine desulfurase family protein [Acidobacteriota bacterium]
MIYFDNNATTQVLPPVREAMMPYLDDAYGNPNSVHQAGNRTRVAVERARGQLARALGVTSSEIVFTGCGSEADNQAVIGGLLARRGEGKNLVVSAVEHPAVGATAAWAAKQFGFELRTAPFKTTGDAVDPTPFLDLIDNNTVLVSVMAVSNETGVIMPLAEIFAKARAVGALTHTDAVQAFGKIPLSPKKLGVDLLSLTAHKFHGPKGVGILYIRRGVKIEPLLHGGSQENARRAGTENVANIVGMGVAAEIAAAHDPADIRTLRDDFEARILDRFGDRISINFRNLPRSPGCSSVRFGSEDGNLLLIKLDRKGLCVSTGAACSSGSLKPSAVLMAAGLSEEAARATLRISFSHLNTPEEVAQAVDILGRVYR